MPRRTLYFGHPFNTFDTELERQLLLSLGRMFTGWDILNPNEKHFQNNFRAAKGLTGNGMTYVFNDVLPNCDGGVFLLFSDGKWGAGVHGEAEALHKLGRKVWSVSRYGQVIRITPGVDDLVPPKDVLSIEETRIRLYDAEGQILEY